MKDERANRTQGDGLPSSWCLAGFDDAFDVISDEGKRIPQGEYLLEGVLPVVDQGEDFIGGYTDKQDQAYSGPLPIIIFGDHTRRVKYIDFRFAAGAQGVKLLRPRAGWFPKFLLHLLPTLELASRGYSRHFQYLRKLPFSLAPFQEQVRIVAEIEKQFTRLDAAVAALKRIQANLKRYRAAVLKAACEGRLVPTEAELARREGRSYEPASVLLERILARRHEILESSQKMGTRTRYSEPGGPSRNEPMNTPEGWALASLDQLTTRVGDVDHRMPKAAANGGIAYVSTRDFAGGDEIDFDNAKRISAEDYELLARKIKPERGDLLLSRYGTVGEVRRVDYASKFQASYSLAIIKLVHPPNMTAYLLIALRSLGLQEQMKRLVRASSQPDLGLEYIRRLTIALPPIEEQKRIVVEAEKRLSIVVELEMQVETDLRRAVGLRQSLLKSAFKGALSPQDPNDEPASILLERIRAERDRRGEAQNRRPKRKQTFRQKEIAKV